MIRRSSVVVLLHWLREIVTDQERSSVLFSTSINFDVSVAEIFGTLARGGKLVIAGNAAASASSWGQIVAALRSHDAVRHALALAREDEPSDNRLVLYYLADERPPWRR